MKKNKILIINIAQYGKHTDSYKYCINLNQKYDMYYICIDNNLTKINDDTNVIYLQDEGSSIKNVFNLIKESRALIKNKNFNIVMVYYFKLCSLVKFFLKNNYILDIRTGSVDKRMIDRIKFNWLMKFESHFFKNISIISESLRESLNYNKKKCYIIPLGSDILSTQNKNFKEKKLNLLYVGALNNRNIYQTIYGLKEFIDSNKNLSCEVSYNIFGDGHKNEIDKLLQTISQCNLERIVKFHGRKSHFELKSYFDNCNIGISYVPITGYYNCQPPTKTFEYINCGMICLATNTNENAKIINESNGVLCEDNKTSFKEALQYILINFERYDSQIIKNTIKEFTWENIVNKKVDHLFQNIIKRKN